MSALPKGLVSIQRASEVLGVSIVTLHGTQYGRYSDFRYKTDGRAVMFDINGFQKYNDTKVELTEKTKLFIEYLKHIEGMTSSRIAKIATMTVPPIADLSIGYKGALKLCLRFRYFYPWHFKRFHEYYGYTLDTSTLKYHIKD